MPEYLSPGVYVEEIKIGAAPIEGVSTSTAGMIGVTEKGSVEGLPELVTSFADYERKFGGFLNEEWEDARFLPFAVQGFFQNGGQRAYIKRVAGDNAKPSELTLKAGIVTRLTEDIADVPSERTTARLVSMRGINVGTLLTFNEKAASIDVTVVSYEGNLISWEKPILDHKFTKAGTMVTAVPPSSNTIKIKAKDPGKWGNNIFVQIDSVNNTSAPLAALDVKKTIQGVPIDFTNITANNVTLDVASYRKVRQNDWIEFRNPMGDIEQRKIDTLTPATRIITWPTNSSIEGEGPLTHDYTGGKINLRDIKAIRLEFDNEGPTNTLIKVKLKDVSKLNDGDWVEFANPSKHEAEQKLITVDYATNEISWSENLTHNYNTVESTVTLLSYTIRVENTVGFIVKDRVHMHQGDSFDDDSIIDDRDDINKKIRIKLMNSTGLSKVYTSGDTIEIKTAARAGSASVKLASVGNFYVGAVVEFDDGTNKDYRTITGIDKDAKTISWTAALSRMYLEGHQARTCEFNINLSYKPDKGAHIYEQHKNLTMDPNTKRYFETIIENDSKLVTAEDLNESPPGSQPTNTEGLPEKLGDGDNGEPPKDKHYIGEDHGPGKRTGIKSLIDIDDISIVAAPGITSQNVQNALIEHCEIVMKDRFAVLDPQKDKDVGGIQVQSSLFNSSYAAIYYPWIKALDPLTDKNILIPPSGHIMGIYARSDSQRGVHKAPANEVIQGITGVEKQINKGEHDILNQKNINAIRVFTGRGIMVWGSRTISSDTLWKYINIRRLFLYLEKSIYKNTQWVVFEPSNEKLWGRVKATINQFLTGVWREGALMGLKAEEAFFVKCDRSTMTQDDIDNGKLIILIGVAPVKPAEFVIFRIAQWAGGAAPKE